MRTPILLLALCIGIGIVYQAGNFTPSESRPLHTNPTVQPTTAAPAPSAPLTPDQARQLSSPQRRALLKKAVESYEPGKSDDYLCSLIAALTKDEISEATAIIEDGITRPGSGNDYPFAIIKTLSTQWGRLDAATWFERATKDVPLQQESYADEVMKGWLETDSTAALAWALAPKKFASRYDGAISVSVDAIVLSTAGDPQKLADSLLALPAGDERVKDCLPVYFELIATTPSHPDPAAIYENIPAPLRKDAWPIAMGRLIEADPQAAAAWLTAHVNDPGRNYSVVRYLIVDLTEKDPAGTAQWAATFPDDERWEPWRHPASVATRTWHEKDPAAAKAWLQTQPPTLDWVDITLYMIGARETPKEPEADKTEN